VLAVNLTGYFLCARYVVPVMKAQHRGAIIQINSTSGNNTFAKKGEERAVV